ncbi:MAG: hypothetical protein ICV73_06615 [Acetobacteraceae bacterium]|nr:hypothetical protein [Acetobacteraceae bacterium]
MLLLAPVLVAAGVPAGPFAPPGARPSTVVKDRVGATAELQRVADPHARGEDVCLRSPPELPGMKLRPKWRVCEPWEAEAKMRRARGGASPPPDAGLGP